mgnify:CR=1 FL=1
MCSRFVTYGVDLPEPESAYVVHMMTLPAMREWCAAARQETEVVPEDEIYSRPDFLKGVRV